MADTCRSAIWPRVGWTNSPALLVAATGVVLILIGAAGCVDNGTRPQEPSSLSLGVDPNGHELTTGQFRRNALLVDFWTTWGAPCRRQLSVLDTLRSEYGDHLHVVAVACRERPDTVAQVLATHPVNAGPKVRRGGWRGGSPNETRRPAGAFSTRLHGRNDNGRDLATRVDSARIVTGEGSAMGRVVVAR